MAVNTRRSNRDIMTILRVIHICLGIIIVILAVILFVSTRDHLILFPIVFILAAISELLNGLGILLVAGRDKSKKTRAWIEIIIAVLLVVIGVISAITVL